MADKEGVAAVDRALSIVDALGKARRTLSLAEISAATGLYRSTILRLVISLSEAGYVQRLSNGHYRLGPKLLQLGESYQATFQIGDIVRPELADLAQRTEESASYFIRDGDTRVCLYRVDSHWSVREHVREGEALPLDRGAGGKVLLAFTEPANPRYEDIRAAMIASSSGERAMGASAIACPIFGAHGTLLGAMTVSGLSTRFTPEPAASMALALFDAAIRASRMLGGDTGSLSAARAAFKETHRFGT